MEEKKGLKETKEALDAVLDSVERLLMEFKDGKKIMDELRDLEAAEYVELGMIVMMRVPALLEAFKKENPVG